MSKKSSDIKNSIAKDIEPQLEAKSSLPKFDYYLVVDHIFWNYRRGDMITLDADIQKVIDAGYLFKCVKVNWRV